MIKEKNYKIHISPSQKNRKGLVTIPFLIAFVVVMFLILSFFRLTLTLTYASAVQYITYASARKLSLGDEAANIQISKGKEKYIDLTSQLLKQSVWFDVPGSPQTGRNPEYTESGYRNLFYGVFVSFTSNLISFRIPLLAEDGDQGLTTIIGSYMGREPSKEECEQFHQLKLQEMRTLIQDNYRNVPINLINYPEKDDNGC